jgi:hypothetical protein
LSSFELSAAVVVVVVAAAAVDVVLNSRSFGTVVESGNIEFS